MKDAIILSPLKALEIVDFARLTLLKTEKPAIASMYTIDIVAESKASGIR